MAEGFEGLEAYQAARQLTRRIFALAKKLPRDERYVLVPQMRRAALSVTNCIAEGHGSYSWKHNISYLYRARGSVNELIDDMGACEDEGYFKAERLADLREDADRVVKLLNGYINHLQRRIDQYMKERKNPGKSARPGAQQTELTS